MQTEENKVPEELTQQQFLEDKENIEGSLALAQAFLNFMGPKWFTAEQLMAKTKMDRMQAIQKLQFVKMFGHAKVRLGGYHDKNKHFNAPLWMITIAPEQKLKALEAVIIDCEDQLSKLNLERKTLLSIIGNPKWVN